MFCCCAVAFAAGSSEARRTHYAHTAICLAMALGEPTDAMAQLLDLFSLKSLEKKGLKTLKADSDSQPSFKP